MKAVMRAWVGCAACILLFCITQAAVAADSSELFLQAYQHYQAGEKLEADAAPQRALLRYREAEQLLAKLSESSPDWQPLVIEYRLKKTRENISRLETATAGMPPLEDELEGPLPTDERRTARPSPAQAPLPPVTTTPATTTRSRQTRTSPQVLPASPAATDSPALSTALRELAALRSELSGLKKENERQSRKLEKADADLKSALFEVDRTKVNVVELKSQLAQANDTIENIKRDSGGGQAALAARERETTAFLKRLAEADADAEVLREENERLAAQVERAGSYIASTEAIRKTLEEERKTLAASRDKSLKELESSTAKLDEAAAKLAEAESRLGKQKEEAIAQRDGAMEEAKANAANVARLTAENAKLQKAIAAAEKAGADKAEMERLAAANKDLSVKLAEAERKLESASGRDSASVALQSDLNSVNDRLLEAQTEIARRDARIDELAAQLDEAAGELARLKLIPIPSSEEQNLLAENDLLRGIILRQIKLQNQRDEARRVLEAEFTRLKLESETLTSYLAVLGAPVLELTAEERTLFKDPVSLLTEPAADKLDVGLAITMPTEAEAARNLVEAGPQGASALTPEARELVREAQQLFNEKNYTGAEKIYQRIVELLPENYFVLSNLGAVQIEAGKLSAAEIALAKAIIISPEDSFAHTHLGIAHSRQGRFEEARSSLARAIELNNKDAVAYNYLGVCLAQQGERDNSEEKLKHAIELDPNYANAHFNLAVLYATTKPPSIELAKQHYQLATQLGAAPDPSLERLIQ